MAAKTLSKKAKQETTKYTKLTKVHVSELQDDFSQYSWADKKEILKELGVGTEFLTCQYCGEVRRNGEFHANSDLMNKTGKAHICKKCCEKIAYNIDEEGKHNPTRESIKATCEYLDKPFLDTVYEASLNEAANTFTGKTKGDVYTAYVKNIAMVNYIGMRYKDSDIFSSAKAAMANQKFVDDLPSEGEIVEMYEQNKKDTIRLLGYDPFLKEALAEQPFLYATLIGYLDASTDANEDRMRVSSIVEIVKGFNHIEKINDLISALIGDKMHMEKNISTIKALEDTKNKITTSILNLAKDNGISLKHSVNGSKGENTLTGMSRRLKDVDLRENEVNSFDIGTCEGMRQVADISNASIIEQIKLDENDYAGMLAEQRSMIVKLQDKSEEWQEKARILLRENIDLKSFLEEKGLLENNMLDSTTILTADDEN